MSGDALLGVRACYDRWAAVYGHAANPLPAFEEPFVRRACRDVRGLRATDLGCGTGRSSAWLAVARRAFVMAANRAGFTVDGLIEAAPDERFAESYRRAAKHGGWPMRSVMMLTRPADGR